MEWKREMDHTVNLPLSELMEEGGVLKDMGII
jgi:hypothetical protein